MVTGKAVAAVAVAGLWKRYGDTEAVRGISFEVETGQVFGLLGPNGAGETTTLECILGLRQSDAGSIHVNGLDLRTDVPFATLSGWQRQRLFFALALKKGLL